MPKVTEAHVEARRTQIVEAACRALSKRGFRHTTMRDICREAGLSSGAVYGYFKSKEQIVEALAEMGRRNTRAALGLAAGGAEGPPTPAHLLGTMMRYLESSESRETARLDVRLWGEGLHTPQLRSLFLDALDNIVKPLAESVRSAQSRGEITPHLDPDAAARVCAAIGLGFEVQRAMDPEADLTGCSAAVSALLDGSFVAKRRKK